MTRKYHRLQSISQEIKKNIAHILQYKIRDPRINTIVTISNIELSHDFSYAKVFVTFLKKKNKEEIEISIKILQEASGFIRFFLGKKMYLRIIPKIKFLYDSSLLRGIKINSLVDDAVKRDRVLRTRL